jgi:hypothetical protein
MGRRGGRGVEKYVVVVFSYFCSKSKNMQICEISGEVILMHVVLLDVGCWSMFRYLHLLSHRQKEKEYIAQFEKRKYRTSPVPSYLITPSKPNHLKHSSLASSSHQTPCVVVLQSPTYRYVIFCPYSSYVADLTRFTPLSTSCE